MIRLNHLALLVSSYRRSRDWYTANLGLELEFEIPERNTVALQDDGGLTLFLSEPAAGAVGATCTLAFEVDDVHATYR
ncbi:MAG TPA: VOC family protein [Gammaproteobacteria bacterium]|nr:VOC family protein [Gammaproteobacteria bacterium]